MVICRFHVDLYEDAACSCNIRHVVPNVGSGFTGCANRVRRTSNNEIDDEAAGEPAHRSRTASSVGTRRSSTRLRRALDLLAGCRYSILQANVVVIFLRWMPIKSSYTFSKMIFRRNNSNSCNPINLFFQIDPI